MPSFFVHFAETANQITRKNGQSEPWNFFTNHIEFISATENSRVVQVLQAARRSGELEPQLVGVQRLHVVAERLVELVAAVLPVAEERMPHIREMRAYLVSPPGQQVDLQQRVPAPGLEHAVLREYRAVLRGLCGRRRSRGSRLTASRGRRSACRRASEAPPAQRRGTALQAPCRVFSG